VSTLFTGWSLKIPRWLSGTNAKESKMNDETAKTKRFQYHRCLKARQCNELKVMVSCWWLMVVDPLAHTLVHMVVSHHNWSFSGISPHFQTMIRPILLAVSLLVVPRIGTHPTDKRTFYWLVWVSRMTSSVGMMVARKKKKTQRKMYRQLIKVMVPGFSFGFASTKNLLIY
jgi:hypothetical protein